MARLRFLTAGESHGPAEVAILEGIPAGLEISVADIDQELKKRATDFGRGGRGVIEKDKVQILSGVRFGKTLGSPIALYVENVDFDNWKEQMSVEDTAIDKEKIAVTKPRPGHADFAGVLKYGFDDVRNVLERASARETVMRVAVGAVCKKLLKQFDVSVASHTLQLGAVRITRNDYNFAEIEKVFETDPLFHCVDESKRREMENEIMRARKNKDTLGGVVEIIVHSMPVGLGSHVHYDRKIDGRIAGALMSIPSVKAVEIGDGFVAAGKTGKQVQDELYVRDGEEKEVYRKTNRMGGIEGGITNGEDIVVRVYHKPLSTLYEPLSTVDIKTLKPDRAVIERSDICVIARAGVISEAMLAFVITDAFLEKFGGDYISEAKRNYQSYTRHLKIKS